MSSWWFSVRPAHLRGGARLPGLLPLFILTVTEHTGQQRSILPSFASSSKDTYRSAGEVHHDSAVVDGVTTPKLFVEASDPPVRYIITVPWLMAAHHQNCLSKIQVFVHKVMENSAVDYSELDMSNSALFTYNPHHRKVLLSTQEMAILTFALDDSTRRSLIIGLLLELMGYPFKNGLRITGSSTETRNGRRKHNGDVVDTLGVDIPEQMCEFCD